MSAHCGFFGPGLWLDSLTYAATSLQARRRRVVSCGVRGRGLPAAIAEGSAEDVLGDDEMQAVYVAG